MLAWCIQNNRVERVTGPIAAAVRESGRLLCDFSFDPSLSLADQLPITDSPRFFYGSSELVKRLHADDCLRANIYFNPATLEQGARLSNRRGQMLNGDGEEMRLGDIAARVAMDSCFVRPMVDIKAFSGAVVTQSGFAAWRTEQQTRNSTLRDEMRVWVAPLKAISRVSVRGTRWPDPRRNTVPISRQDIRIF